MDLQADINWIKSELQKVNNPDLLAAFKNLLRYNNKKYSSIIVGIPNVLANQESVSLYDLVKESGYIENHTTILESDLKNP